MQYISAVDVNKPTLQLLNRHVKPQATCKWKSLGAELNIEAGRLDIIEENNPGNVENCCTEMFNIWLRIDNEASWAKLVNALKAPDVELNVLAEEIARRFEVGRFLAYRTSLFSYDLLNVDLQNNDDGDVNNSGEHTLYVKFYLFDVLCTNKIWNSYTEISLAFCIHSYSNVTIAKARKVILRTCRFPIMLTSMEGCYTTDDC